MTESGVVIQRVRVGNSTVITYGPDAPEVTFRGRGKAALAAIDVVPSPRRQRQYDPTVFEMTMASGHFTREEACDFARAIDPRGCVTSAQLRARSGTSARSGPAPVRRMRTGEARWRPRW